MERYFWLDDNGVLRSVILVKQEGDTIWIETDTGRRCVGKANLIGQVLFPIDHFFSNTAIKAEKTPNHKKVDNTKRRADNRSNKKSRATKPRYRPKKSKKDESSNVKPIKKPYVRNSLDPPDFAEGTPIMRYRENYYKNKK